MSVVDKTMDALGLTKRKKFFGLPVGPREIDWRRAAGLGAGTSAGAGALGAVGKQLLGNGSSLLEAPKALLAKGEDALESITDIGDRASSVSDAVSGESSVFGKIKAAVQAFGGDDEPGDEKKQRLIIQEQIDVAVPAGLAYDTWTDFDEFEEIFRGIQHVEADPDEGEEDTDDGGEEGGGEVQMQAKILFSTRRWTSEITHQTPGKRIAWNSSGDVDHAGAVSFHELADSLTRVHLEMEYHPTGIVEKFGNLFLAVRHRVRKDLRLFKHYLELKAVEDAEGAEDAEDAEDGDGSSDYGDLTRNELREKLQERGLSVAGTKAQLVERLEKHDQGEDVEQAG